MAVDQDGSFRGRHFASEVILWALHRAVLRLPLGGNEEPSVAVLDSRTLRLTPESGSRAGWDGHKRSRGCKLHLAVDTMGHLLALHVTPANEKRPRRRVVERLLPGWHAAVGWPATACA